MDLPVLDISCQWDHTPCVLLSASLPEHHVFKVRPRAAVWGPRPSSQLRHIPVCSCMDPLFEDILAIVNDAAMKTCAQVFYDPMFSCLRSEISPTSGPAGSDGNSTFHLLRNRQTLSKRLTFPPAVREGSGFSRPRQRLPLS